MSWINFQPVYFHVINRNISAWAEKVFIQMHPIRAHFKKMANENVTSHGLKSTENVTKRRFRPEKKTS